MFTVLIGKLDEAVEETKILERKGEDRKKRLETGKNNGKKMEGEREGCMSV